jgi:hypothetical protein
LIKNKQREKHIWAIKDFNWFKTCSIWFIRCGATFIPSQGVTFYHVRGFSPHHTTTVSNPARRSSATPIAPTPVAVLPFKGKARGLMPPAATLMAVIPHIEELRCESAGSTSVLVTHTQPSLATSSGVISSFLV